jgi:hypothetical protein
MTVSLELLALWKQRCYLSGLPRKEVKLDYDIE